MSAAPDALPVDAGQPVDSGQPDDPARRANLKDWLAVAAGTLGALMAMMDISIVNASLPVIQGEIGATPSEGTWVSTAYLVAEIIAIPLTAWLERLMGMRRLLIGASLLFTAFSMLCGFSGTLGMMIFGRLGQGLAGGVLIPTGLTIIANRLPPSQQSQGLALMAVAALVGPALGPVLGGWLTDNISWHYAFFMNAPICAVLVALLVIGVDATKGDWGELRAADWPGIAGITLGLGGLTTVLEEGSRELWFESAYIWRLTVMTALGFALIGWSQYRPQRPIIRLALLANNASLSSGVSLMMVVGILMYGTLYITPQFLAAVAGYSAYQAGEICFISAACAIPTAIAFPFLVSRIDTRLIIGGAMAICGVSSLVVSHLTVQDDGSAFILAQALLGLGLALCGLPLQQVVMSSVSVEDVPEANGMISVARNLGGSVGLAAIASFQDQRLDFHHWRLSGEMAANSPEVQGHLAELTAAMGGGSEGVANALRLIDGQVNLQALVMTFNDLYLAMALIGFAVVPLVLFLKPIKPGTAMAVGH